MSTELDAACQSLGIVADAITPGHAILRMTIGDRMVNEHGMAHGGYLFLLADAAFAYAANHGEAMVVAQAAQIVYLKPVNPGNELTAEAVERTRFGRSALFDVAIRTTDGTVIAEFRGQSQTLTGRAKTQALAPDSP